MPKSARIGICVYCGLHGKLTRDHVPPRCLFPPAERLNLVTVDACEKCNSGFSADDEYFRLMLSLRADLPDTAETRPLKEAVRRSLAKPEAKQFRQSIRSKLARLPYFTPAGLYLGDVPTVQVDGKRLRRTAERIVRGLYSKYLGFPVPAGYEVTAVLMDFQRDDSVVTNPVIQDMFRELGKQNNHRQFGKSLDLWYGIANDDPRSSIWHLRLHGVFAYLGFAAPADA